MRSALITGVTGQDGFYLAELLLEKGYRVFGFAHNNKEPQLRLGAQLSEKIDIFYGDISDEEDIIAVIKRTKPEEIYNFASQSQPGASWNQVPKTLGVNGLGAVRLFEAVRVVCPNARLCHASSSEMFGQTKVSPQNEETPFAPTNPYAASKVYAHQMARIYRESYGLFISSAILFNHESERRPLHFVSQKVAYGAACAALGIEDSPDKNERGMPIVAQGRLALGNLEVSRDWGYAPDYVRAMWLMLQQDKPDDFVIGTGRLHTLRALCETAYRYVNKDWQNHIISDPALLRPLESTQTLADNSKIKRILGWRSSIDFEGMVRKMVDAQIKQLSTSVQSKLIGTT